MYVNSDKIRVQKRYLRLNKHRTAEEKHHQTVTSADTADLIFIQKTLWVWTHQLKGFYSVYYYLSLWTLVYNQHRQKFDYTSTHVHTCKHTSLTQRNALFSL